MTKEVEQYARPDVSEIGALLCQKDALIVHFSGCPKGRGLEEHDFVYPDDLKHILDGNAQGGLSCSVVNPNDTFIGSPRNAFGNIGVILKMNRKYSLLDASIGDCGSMSNECHERIPESYKDISLDYLESTISKKGDTHNEWIIADFKVIGLLAVPPFEVNVMKFFSEKDDKGNEIYNFETKDITSKSLLLVKQDFPNEKVYTFNSGNLNDFDAVTGNTNNVTWENIYSSI